MQKKLLFGILLIVISVVFYRIFFSSTAKNTFPFSEAENVELVFYKDAIEEGADLKKFSQVQIKKKVKLNDDEKQELFEILYKEKCLYNSAAACYLPRHALVFTQKNDTIGIIEVCLECLTMKVTEGIEWKEMCDEKVAKLDKLFKSKQ